MPFYFTLISWHIRQKTPENIPVFFKNLTYFNVLPEEEISLTKTDYLSEMHEIFTRKTYKQYHGLLGNTDYPAYNFGPLGNRIIRVPLYFVDTIRRCLNVHMRHTVYFL